MEDLTGKKFGRLSIIEKAFKKDYTQYYKCKCDCGTIKIINGSSIKKGDIVSCGCLRKERFLKFITTHGKTNTRLHTIWNGMKQRCQNKKCKYYKNYGNKGITICDDWSNTFMSFYNWAYENGYADNLTIDRINNRGNYDPYNCRWITIQEQQHNTSLNNVIEINGKKFVLAEVARMAGVADDCIRNRIRLGLKNEELLKPAKYYLQDYVYNLTSPNGIKHNNIMNIREFCKNNNLKFGSLEQNFLKDRKFYKKWKINRVKINK